MKHRTRKTAGKVLLTLGLVVLGSGIYHLGYHHGLEKLRPGDSGLGGFAEWANAAIQIVSGSILSIVGALLSKTYND